MRRPDALTRSAAAAKNAGWSLYRRFRRAALRVARGVMRWGLPTLAAACGRAESTTAAASAASAVATPVHASSPSTNVTPAPAPSPAPSAAPSQPVDAADDEPRGPR